MYLSVSVVRSQSCSATTVFGTDSQEIVEGVGYDRENVTVVDLLMYFNTNTPAPCSGILTMWHYCYYTEPPEDEFANGRIRFGIARPLQSGDANSFEILEDSFTDATIEIDSSSVSSLVCGNHTPSTSDFQVEAGDVLLACVNESSPIRVVSSGVVDSEITWVSTVSCSDIKDTGTLSGHVLHVHAGIY